MARINHVKAAQQRYRTVPVIDPETGQQKVTPVTRNGQQRVTKRGTPVIMRVTREDRTQPLPLEVCDYCRKDIEVGTPYKWIKPKSGPYGGHKRSRHESCPSWQVWDYSSSMSARIAQIVHDAENQSFDDADGAQAILEDAASQIRDLANEKREAAENIESGFGHETEQSAELNDIADQLESWADEVETADLPETECPTCGGTGKMDETVQADADTDEDEPCTDCDGEGIANDWQEQAQDVITEALANCPV